MKPDNECVFCRKVYYETQGKRQKKVEKNPMGKSAVMNLIEKSKLKNDNNWKEWEKNTIYYHDGCRRKYIHDVASKSSDGASTSSAPLSSTQWSLNDNDGSEYFDFEVHCLFCGRKCDCSIDPIVDRQYVDKQILIRSQSLDNESSIKMRLKNVTSLIDVKARYHDECYITFFTTVSCAEYNNKKNEISEIDKAWERVFKHIEMNTIEPMLLCEFKEIMGEYFPERRTFYRKLKKKYGDDILVAQHVGRNTKIYYKNFNIDKMTSDWLCGESLPTDKKKFLYNITAEMLATDIQAAKCDNEFYKSPGDFFTNMEDDIPDSLNFFLSKLLFFKKPPNEKKQDPRYTHVKTISHAILTSMRPNAFTSYLQLALGTYVLRKTGSKLIIDILYSLGICSSYHNIRLYEASVLLDPPEMKINGTYMQFVFSNTDHNAGSIDGHRTFHCLGGIRILTRNMAVALAGKSKKLGAMPSSEEIAAVNAITPIELPVDFQGGLDAITFEDTANFNIGTSSYLPTEYTSYVWTKYFKIENIPTWKGFWETLYSKNAINNTSKVVCIPFIYHKASDYVTVYTALKHAIKEARENHQEHCVVTFDLPLWKISVDIISGLTDEDMEFIIPKLGGFHLIRSYLGAVGYLMLGSGIEELLATIYAQKTVKHILSGHAFTRGVRAHILVYTALGTLICEKVDAEKKTEYKHYIRSFLEKFDRNESEGPYIGDYQNDQNFIEMNAEFLRQLNDLKNIGATSKLWVQYFECITIMLQYIEAERTGNWSLHLQSVEKMLPIFHAAGQIHYAKCARIYLQQMDKLNKKIDSEAFKLYTTDGYFTVHRTDKAFNGVWTDMTIEQTLNRFYSNDLVHGRGVTESGISRYLGAMPICSMVMEGLEDFCGVQTQNIEQQVDSSKSRMNLDNKHLDQILTWFRQDHDPFLIRTSLVSLSTSVIGGPDINCHEAFEVGKKYQALITGKNTKTFSSSGLATAVKNLTIAKTRTHLGGKYEALDALKLHQEIQRFLETDDNLKEAIEYELSPYPLSLFTTKGLMRKPEKDQFYNFIKRKMSVTPQFIQDLTIVLDGEYLLDAVPWPTCDSFQAICEAHATFVAEKYSIQYQKKCVYIIFHLYNNEIHGVKSYEQFCRQEQSVGADFHLTYNSVCNLTKKQILSNIHNKQKFVQMLVEYLKETIHVILSPEDGDTEIVQTAINLASQGDNSVGVCTNSEDILILLVTMNLPSRNNIYYLKKKSETSMDVCSVSQYQDWQSFLLFVHVFGGCCSTSNIYNKDKKTILNLVEKDPDLQVIARIFYQSGNSEADIYSATEKLFVHLYTTSRDTLDSINDMRYTQYKLAENLTTEKRLASLPPTLSAAHQHGKRVYYQMQRWLGQNLEAEQWGWKRYQFILVPVMTTEPPAPGKFTKVIFCGCSTNCQNKQCKCRKTGIACTKNCKNCMGISCINTSSITLAERKNDDDSDNDDDNVREREEQGNTQDYEFIDETEDNVINVTCQHDDYHNNKMTTETLFRVRWESDYGNKNSDYSDVQFLDF